MSINGKYFTNKYFELAVGPLASYDIESQAVPLFSTFEKSSHLFQISALIMYPKLLKARSQTYDIGRSQSPPRHAG